MAMITILPLHNFYEMRQVTVCEMVPKSHIDFQNVLHVIYVCVQKYLEEQEIQKYNFTIYKKRKGL